MQFSKKECPILKKCRHEAFFSSYKIMEMVVLLLFALGSLYVVIKTSDMIWRIGFVIILAICVSMFFGLNIIKLRNLSETAKYLETLTDEDYSDLAAQVAHAVVIDKPVYLLDGWVFSPSAAIAAKYNEITGVEIVTLYYNGMKNGYRLLLRFRGVKREIVMNRLSGFNPEMFKAELELKRQNASASGYNIVASEKRV